MKTLNLGGMAMVLIAGCGGLSDADSADLSQEAEVVSSPLESGHYGDVLDVVVTDGTISGRFKDSVGDPLHGGASCEFTFSGKLGTGKSMISVVDGYSHVAGTLSVKANAKPGKPGVVLRLNADPSACSRAAPVLLETSGVSFELTRKMDAGVAGYRSVSAEKAFFYDAPGKAQRSAFVIAGDTLIVTGAESTGFMPVKYIGAKNTTVGFVKTSDLASSTAKTATAE